MVTAIGSSERGGWEWDRQGRDNDDCAFGNSREKSQPNTQVLLFHNVTFQKNLYKTLKEKLSKHMLVSRVKK